MRKSSTLILIFIFLTLTLIPGQEEILKKAYELYSQKKYTEALELVEKGIQEFGETSNLLRAKYYILIELKKFDEALDIAIKKEQISKRKSPWNCIDIAIPYIYLKDNKKALDWLNEAVNRGFISYHELYSDEFKPLREEKRFNEIISKIKDKIGIGKIAKDFTVELLSGEKFTLSTQKGKVILVDFWASWCGPCRREIPDLKKYYEEFKNEGFEIIGISLDTDKDTLEKFLKKEGISWKISFTGKGWNDETARLYGVNSIPSFWLVDKKGILRSFGLRGEKLRDKISELIGEN